MVESVFTAMLDETVMGRGVIITGIGVSKMDSALDFAEGPFSSFLGITFTRT